MASNGDVAAGGDFTLTTEELRTVARFALGSAEEVLALFESVAPGDPRPRAALDAARAFTEGAPRGRLQRVTSVAAHRAAREVGDGAVGREAASAEERDAASAEERDAAAHAARAAGDAAAAAYLHPLAQASQVGHILRASAHTARALELATGDPAAAEDALARCRERATPVLREVLLRYPPAPTGRGRLAQLMASLDTTLRSEDPAPDEGGRAQGWFTHGGPLAEATDRARRFVEQEFPRAAAAFLGGSVATGRATESSDLDLLIVLPAPWEDVAFVETSRFEGQLVEAFVYGQDALTVWLDRGRSERRPVLDRLLADGIPLVKDPLTEELSRRTRAVLDAGPGPADPDDLARRAYSLSALIDDLTDRSAATGPDPAEATVLTWTLWCEAAELALIADHQWLGTGKWLVRELRAAEDRHDLAAWAEDPADTDRLVTIARAVLAEAGGYRQEGFLRGERPPGL